MDNFNKFEDLTVSQRKKIVYTSMAMLCCISTLYLNVASFFPLFVEKHYKEHISSTMVAVIMSTCEFMAMIFAPINAPFISKIGRKNAILIGLLIQTVGTIMIGLTSIIPYEKWRVFFGASILARAL